MSRKGELVVTRVGEHGVRACVRHGMAWCPWSLEKGARHIYTPCGIHAHGVQCQSYCIQFLPVACMFDELIPRVYRSRSQWSQYQNHAQRKMHPPFTITQHAHTFTHIHTHTRTHTRTQIHTHTQKHTRTSLSYSPSPTLTFTCAPRHLPPPRARRRRRFCSSQVQQGELVDDRGGV